jgi:subtilisin family serine protease
MTALPVPGAEPDPANGLLSAYTGAGVTVVVIDSGWARSLTDDRVLPGVGLVDPDDEYRVRQTTDDEDRLGHGTACADLVLRAAPGARIVPVRVFGKRLETSIAILVAALEWANAAGVRLINLSLGTLRADAFQPLYVACEHARRSGAVIVAAHRPGVAATLPAAFDNVISVGGTPIHGHRGVLYRPGEAVEVLAAARHGGVRCGPGGRRTVGGNSFAAPIVTGLIARMMERTPDLGVEGVRGTLAHWGAAG